MHECAKKGVTLTMCEWSKITSESAHLRQRPTMLVDAFVQIRGRVHPRAPAKSMARAESLPGDLLNYLVGGNDDVDALEYIIPYPLFSPELNVVGSRKHSSLECR